LWTADEVWRAPQLTVSVDGRELTGPVTGVFTLALGRLPLSSAVHSFTIRMPFEAPFSVGLIDLTGLSVRPAGVLRAWSTGRCVLSVGAARGFLGAGRCAASWAKALSDGLLTRSDKPAKADPADDTASAMAITITADLQQRTVCAAYNSVPMPVPLFTDIRDLERCTPFVAFKNLSAGAVIRIDSEDE
jgi:hypothetical protein